VAVDLLRNGALITDTWADAYFGEFTQGSATGERRAVLASAGMPAVTARLRFEPPELLETEVIDDACLRVVNYAGIIGGTLQRRDAGRLIDAIVTPEFQFFLGDDRFFLGDDRGSRPARIDLVIPELVATYGADVDVAVIDPMVDDMFVQDLLLVWDQAVIEAATEPEPEVVDPDAAPAP